MGLRDRRISAQEQASLNVKSVPGSRLQGTVRDNKHVFDKLVEFLIERYNGMIDDLTESEGASAASQISADPLREGGAATVQGILNELKGEITESGGTSFEVGHGLKMEENSLCVNAVSDFDGDNTLPITAAAVQATVGNIEILLETL